MKFYLTLCLFLGVAVAEAANVYVRQGAAGLNNGTDWNNAFTSFPSTMVRGNTYFLAPGDYSGGDGLLNDAASGTTRIVIRKATASNHGTDTGWQDSFGVGQARIPALDIRKPFYTIDGSYRGSDPWSISGYGFSIRRQGGQYIQASGNDNSTANDVIIANIAMGNLSQTIDFSDKGGTAVYVVGPHNFVNWRVSSNLFKYVNLAIREGSAASSDWIIEHNIFAYSWNKICIRWEGNGTARWHIRYNKFLDNCLNNPQDSTSGQTTLLGSYGFFGAGEGAHIYGNIVSLSGTYVNQIGFQDGIFSAAHDPEKDPNKDLKPNWKVYNNVFHNLGWNSGGGRQLSVNYASPGLEMYNNVYINCNPSAPKGARLNGQAVGNAIVSHNWVYPGTSSGMIAGSADPFIDSANLNFTPKDPDLVSGLDIVDAGKTLSGSFNSVDLLGNTRGSFGSGWDIGAIEYGGIPEDPPDADTEAPTAPTGVTATGVSQSGIEISWTASTDNFGAQFLSYRIFRDGQQITTTTSLNYTDSAGLSPSTTYSYFITAVDLAGNISSPSSTDTGTTLSPDVIDPTQPTGLVATPESSTVISLVWDASTDNVGVTGYRIYRNSSLISTSLVNSYVDAMGLSAETEYTYTVAAIDAAGNESTPSISDAATTLEAPPFPSDMKVWLLASVGLTLDTQGGVSQWADQSGNSTHATQDNPDSRPLVSNTILNGYPAVRFYGGPYFLTFNMAVNGLTGMTIALVARNDLDQSAGTTEAENAAVFWNETSGWGTVYLSPYQDEVNFRFGTLQASNRHRYSRPSSISTNFSISIAMHSNNVDRLYINGALVVNESGKVSALAGNTAIGNLGRGYNNNSHYLGHIAEVIVYDRALSAVEVDGVNTYLANKYFGDGGGGEDPGDTEAPTVPADLAATAFSPTRIDLAWTASTDNVGVDHYKIYRDGVLVGNTTGTSFSDVGLTPATEYDYTVAATDAAQNMSAQSTQDSATTLSLPSPTVKPLTRPGRGSPAVVK